jgi:hypothetical protein
VCRHVDLMCVKQSKSACVRACARVYVCTCVYMYVCICTCSLEQLFLHKKKCMYSHLLYTNVSHTGWEPGPDYYSTARWDNADIYPSNLVSHFDPLMGATGCPGCNKKHRGMYVMYVSQPLCTCMYLGHYVNVCILAIM